MNVVALAALLDQVIVSDPAVVLPRIEISLALSGFRHLQRRLLHDDMTPVAATIFKVRIRRRPRLPRVKNVGVLAARVNDALLAPGHGEFGDGVDAPRPHAPAGVLVLELEGAQVGVAAAGQLGVLVGRRRDGAEGADEGSAPADDEREDHGHVGGDDGHKCLADGPGSGLLCTIDRVGEDEDAAENPGHGDEETAGEEEDEAALFGLGEGGAPEHGDRDAHEVKVGYDVQDDGDEDVDLGDGGLAEVWMRRRG